MKPQKQKKGNETTNNPAGSMPSMPDDFWVMMAEHVRGWLKDEVAGRNTYRSKEDAARARRLVAELKAQNRAGAEGSMEEDAA